MRRKKLDEIFNLRIDTDRKKIYRSNQTHSVITSFTCVPTLITIGIMVRTSKNSIGEVHIRHNRENS